MPIEMAVRIPTCMLEPPIFRISDDKTVLTSMKMEANARNRACQIKAIKFLL